MNENHPQAGRVDSPIGNPSDDMSRRNATHIHVANGQDERYPGTFFRIPGIPAPGKTTWSLVK